MTSHIVRTRLLIARRGFYACIEYRAFPLRGAPLGPVSRRVAAALLLSAILSNEHLGRVAARMNVPPMPELKAA